MTSQHHLTIYLLREPVKRPQDALRPSLDLSRTQIPHIEHGQPILYTRRSEDALPVWATLFEGHVDIAQLGVFSASTAAVLLIEAAGRLFAITFGHGRHLLKEDIREERFGLLVTLNSIRPDSIKSLDKFTFDAISRQSREQAIKSASTREFGLDVERDLLTTVTGEPDVPSLGSRMTGRDALAVSVAINLTGLPSLLADYLKQWKKEDYKKEYPWVDNIAEVKDPAILARLDGQIAADLRAHKFESMWLSVPDLISWADVKGFRFGDGNKTEVHPDMHLLDYLDYLPKSCVPDVDGLRRHTVAAIRASDGRVDDKWNVYRCLTAEVEIDGATFLLNNGKWYEIRRSFVDDVQRFIASVPDLTLPLPKLKRGETEGEYNKRAAARRFALMDQRNIVYPGAPSRFEFCDLYSGRTREMIHVKRYSGSATLSHLFAQGLTSAELFKSDPRFRAEVNLHLTAPHRLADPDAEINPADYTVAFAIVSWSRKELRLPFFSQINLRHIVRRLHGFGYKTGVAKILNDTGKVR